MSENLRNILVSDLSEVDAKRELKNLSLEISKYDEAYHSNDAPIVSDGEYDVLRKRNKEIEMKFPHLVDVESSINKVGAAAAVGFTKITHTKPMLSLDNVFSEEQLKEFLLGIRRFLKELKDDPEIPLEMVAEPKIDGLSLSLSYQNRKLVCAATRGDGLIGEDVTKNIKNLKNIPLVLQGNAPSSIEVRGEIYLTDSKVRSILNGLPDKSESKTTTSKKFKADFINYFSDDKYKSMSILEVGSSLGHSTKMLSHLFREVTALDNLYERHEQSKQLNSDRHNIHYVVMDVYTQSWEQFGKMDAVFIDCVHDYAHIKSDIENALKFGKGTIIAFDDYGLFPDLKTANLVRTHLNQQFKDQLFFKIQSTTQKIQYKIVQIGGIKSKPEALKLRDQLKNNIPDFQEAFVKTVVLR